MKLWKVLGIAGLAGVAATGVIMARDQRQRTQLQPHEIRARLHDRLEQAEESVAEKSVAEESVAEAAGEQPRTRRWRRWLRRDR